MPMSQQHNTKHPDTRTVPNRKRASGACQRCRRRRERCDAGVRGIPCSRCENSHEPECILVPSRRGKYTRKRSEPQSQPAFDQQTTRQAEVSPTAAAATTIRSESQAEVANPAISPAISCSTQTSASSAATVSSYRELTWTALFRHLVDSDRVVTGDSSDELIDKCAITYLGESFPLSMVLDSIADRSQPVLHHAGPKLPPNCASGSDEAGGGPLNTSTSQLLSTDDMQWLRAKGAFEYPAPQLLDGLVSAFVERFFPLYPIVHLDETLQQVKDRTIPWILLHAICLVAANICPAPVLYQAGYTRREARELFYGRVKALFDFSYEVNKLVLLQTTILMGFSIGRPNEYWNFWSWHTTSVTIAEALGVHRSMAASQIPQRDKSLLRRLWWVIVLRDISGSSLIGRPFRIDLQQCDMEMVTIDDFELDRRSDALRSHPLRDTFPLYQIQMSKLATTLRQIILTRYGPARASTAAAAADLTSNNGDRLNEALDSWLLELPPVLKTHQGPTGEIFGRALSMVYQQQRILINLQSAARAGGSSDSAYSKIGRSSSSRHSERILNEAAHAILSIACTLVRQSSAPLIPHEAFPPLFSAQGVFLRRTKSPNQGVADTARGALTTCQLLWHTIGEVWDSAPWVMELFDRMASLVVDQRMEAEPEPEEEEANMHSAPAININHGDSSIDWIRADPTLGGLSTCLDVSLEDGFNFGGFPPWTLTPANMNLWME
ncbi:fungal-specific transcription factor domain-containing protein [Aspergillus insuetus]